jgi:hypothetical protein
MTPAMRARAIAFLTVHCSRDGSDTVPLLADFGSLVEGETLEKACKLAESHAAKIEGDPMLSTRTTMTRNQAALAVTALASAIRSLMEPEKGQK